MSVRSARIRGLVVAACAALALAGCGAPGPLIPEQREAASRGPVDPAPERYRVRAGDTLYSIAFRYGLDWRRVARWNRIDAPYTIRVDEFLRLRPPPDMRAAVAEPSRPAPGGTTATPERRPSPSAPTRAQQPEPEPEPEPEAPPPRAAETPARAERPALPAAASAPVDVATGGASRSVAGVTWRWPVSGRITKGFDARDTRKGILVAGEAGQPVRAAADGEVVYSGDGLIGYGQLIIIKHSDRMLSAYAHNRERLVDEGARVRAGQLIARMGRNERDQTVLHFEIRRDGQPVNPVDYLPPR